MARKAMIAKEKQKAEMVERYREKRDQLRKILKSSSASQEEKIEARFQMDRLPRRSIGVRVVNRCRVTGRSRGYMRKFQMSRISFRELAGHGMIPGVTKSSW